MASQLALARALLTGVDGVARDVTAAVDLLFAAAAGGDAEAFLLLGRA